MKKLVKLFCLALFAVSAVSCEKAKDDFPPYYQLAYDFREVSFGQAPDFSAIFNIIDSYVNKRVDSESEAIAMFNEVVSKADKVTWHATDDSYVSLYIVKLVVTKKTDTIITYDFDTSYKSPKKYVWDSQGSHDQ